MRRRNVFEQSLGTDKWTSSDPLDNEIIRKLFKREIREGEEKLMLAVLSDAIELFQKHVLSTDEKGRNLFHEVEEWFLAKESDQLFCFESICETLELHPDYLRQRLISWKEAGARNIFSTPVTGVAISWRKRASRALHLDFPKLRRLNPNSAVGGENGERGASLPERSQWVSAPKESCERRCDEHSTESLKTERRVPKGL